VHLADYCRCKRGFVSPALRCHRIFIGLSSRPSRRVERTLQRTYTTGVMILKEVREELTMDADVAVVVDASAWW
jgi:hypothetical protein